MKKLLFLTVFLISVFFTSELSAQKLSHPQQQKVDKLFKNSETAHFTVRVNSGQEIPQLAKIISVEKVKGNSVLAHANKEQFSKFIALNYVYEVVPGPQKKKPVATAKKTTTTKKTATGKKTTTAKKTTTTTTTTKKAVKK